MKAIKIDVRNKTVSIIDLKKGFRNTQKELECELFTCIGLPKNDALYIDDEGLLKEEPIGAFMIGSYPQPLSGHGLIIGTDEETGESQDCQSTLEEIKKSVRFIPVQMLKGVPLESNFIPLNDKEMEEYFSTGKLPIGKTPTNPQ